MKTEIHSLYILKSLGVLFVLMTHFHCYKSQYFEPLYRCGVPIFFIISGYFLYAEDESKQIFKYKKSISKILILILFFQAAYFLLAWHVHEIISMESYDQVIRLFIYGDSISGHLWFLSSYLWTLVLLWACKKNKINDHFVYLLGLVCMIEGLMEGQYAFLFGLEHFSIQQYYLPWLTSSLPMIIAGYAIHKNFKMFQKLVRNIRGNIFLIVCCILVYTEHYLLSLTHHYTGTFMLSTFLLVFILFVICVNRPNLGQDSYLEKIGKEHSGNIYYWQFFPYLLFMENIIGKFHLEMSCLPIMIAILIGWSYTTNYILTSLKKYHIIK